MPFERYDILSTPDERHMALVQRRRDGKTAVLNALWFKPSPDGDGHVPRSRTKAIRLESHTQWEAPATTEVTE